MKKHTTHAAILLGAVAILGAVYFFGTNGSPSIKVISPAAGDVLTPGSVYQIKWDTRNVPASNKISVTIRRVPPPPLQTEGQEFDPIVFISLPDTGSKDWTVSDMYPDGTYVIGLTAYESIPVTNPISAESAQFRIAGDVLVGGDRDEHGCIGSAGYQWCEAKSSCIRSWETFCTAAAGKTVTFACDSSKSIIATFYPTDDKFVDLKLSDGRNMSVPHAISASGARYAKADESFVFWNKGDTAFITEGTEAQAYSNCTLQ